MRTIVLIAACLFLLTACQNTSETQAPVAESAAEKAAPVATEETQAAPEAAPEVAATADQGTATPADSAGETEAGAVKDGEAAIDFAAVLPPNNFILEKVDGQDFTYPVSGDEQMIQPNISFAEWPRATGRMCNNFNGEVAVQGNTIVLKNAISTMMMCHVELLNQTETIFHQMLAKGATMTLVDGVLTLTGSDHVLVFRKSDPAS